MPEPTQEPQINPFDEHTRMWADEIMGRVTEPLQPCRRCGHSPDVHSHDDADNHDVTDPDCPFRCQRCDCSDYSPNGRERGIGR